MTVWVLPQSTTSSTSDPSRKSVRISARHGRRWQGPTTKEVPSHFRGGGRRQRRPGPSRSAANLRLGSLGGGLYVQADVEGGRRRGQGAGRDEVGPGVGEGGQRLEGQAPGHLEQRASG